MMEETSSTDKKLLRLIFSLKNMDSQAIRLVTAKITPDIKKLVLKYRLPLEVVDEIVHDALLVLIKSIRHEKFEYQGYHPSAYAMGIAQKLIANKARSSKPRSLELKTEVLVSDFDTERYMLDKERQLIIEKLLKRLGKTCRQIIQLKYFEERKDKEIVTQKLTDFTSTDSLKSKRSQCMKKLAELTRNAGIRKSF